MNLNRPVVGITLRTPARVIGLLRDGGVFAFGNAGFVVRCQGSDHGDQHCGMAPTISGRGYWMVGSDGGVFAFGDAGFVGSLPGLGVKVNDIVGIIPTTDDLGYWLVGRDGGVFAFGDAGFVGSLPGLGITVNDITGIATPPDNAATGWSAHPALSIHSGCRSTAHAERRRREGPLTAVNRVFGFWRESPSPRSPRNRRRRFKLEV